MANFLLEIGLEEVPARMIAGAQAELLRRTVALLEREKLVDAGVAAKSYSTPRRLAVWVSGVRARQEDVREEVMGPAVKIAFKDGVPGPAAEAFARKNGVGVDALKVVETPKGEYVSVSVVKAGRSAAEVIAEGMPKEIAGIYWAKNMYWRAGKPERFVRPVLWMVCLLGDEMVPVSFAGRTAGRATFGHRVLAGGEAFEVVSAESYAAQLEGEYVIADVEARRQKTRKALDRVCRTVPGARWREDQALVDAVTHLTEWPDVLLGSFEAEYLALPEEVLVTVMRDHQKYFAVEDARGKLAPYFLTVTNIALDEANAAVIRQGNERVLRARFNDARFFWEFDQRVPLAERVKLLEKVTFQKELGSYAAKSSRVSAIAAQLGSLVAAKGRTVDSAALAEAARLAKTDLTTELVKEFTELQGMIGGLYAEKQGVGAVAWGAIYDQYLPASAGDAIPRSVEGALLGIADRMDTIAGMFGLGMEPTGSKDPFALRRAANAVVRILAESSVGLGLEQVMGASGSGAAVLAKMRGFFRERVEFYLRDGRGQAYDVVAAVMAAGYDDLHDVVARAEAVTAVRGAADFAAVSAAVKRMKNILVQAGGELAKIRSQDARGTMPAQQALYERGFELELRVFPDYESALKAMAAMRPEVDAFFEQVMVNDPDEEVRLGRLRLLRGLVEQFSRIADFSEIVMAG